MKYCAQLCFQQARTRVSVLKGEKEECTCLKNRSILNEPHFRKRCDCFSSLGATDYCVYYIQQVVESRFGTQYGLCKRPTEPGVKHFDVGSYRGYFVVGNRFWK